MSFVIRCCAVGIPIWVWLIGPGRELWRGWHYLRIFLTAESFNILTRNQDSPENRSIHYVTRRFIRSRPRSTSTLLHINRALYLLPLPRAKIFSCPFAQIKLHLLTEWNNRLSSQNRFLSGSIIPSCASSYRWDNSIFRTDRYRYLCKCLAQIKMIALPRLDDVHVCLCLNQQNVRKHLRWKGKKVLGKTFRSRSFNSSFWLGLLSKFKLVKEHI